MTNEQEATSKSAVAQPSDNPTEEAEVETVQEPVVHAQLTADDFDTEEEDDEEMDEPA